MDLPSFTTAYDDATAVLTVTGDIDEVSGPELRDAIGTASATYTRDVTVDLTPVSFMPSLAVGVLAVALRTAREAGTTIELVAADGSLSQRVLAICALPHRSSLTHPHTPSTEGTHMPRRHGLQAAGECCVTASLPFDRTAARGARVQVTAALESAGVRATAIEDAALVTSELVTNGVLHGEPDSSGRIQVSWCLDETSLLISVVDGGSTGTLRPLELTDDAVSGRGLAIVDSLCANWKVDQSHGTRVTAELVLA